MKNFLSIVIIFIFSFFVNFNLSSCVDTHKTEKGLIDSLHLILDECEELLDIDYPLLNRRLELIQEITSFFQGSFEEEITLEIGTKLDKIRTIKKMYSNATSKGPESQAELNDLRNQLNELKKSLKGITKEQFKQFYNVEKVHILELFDISKNINRDVYGAEGEYNRLEDFFDPYMVGR